MPNMNIAFRVDVWKKLTRLSLALGKTINAVVNKVIEDYDSPQED